MQSYLRHFIVAVISVIFFKTVLAKNLHIKEFPDEKKGESGSLMFLYERNNAQSFTKLRAARHVEQKAPAMPKFFKSLGPTALKKLLNKVKRKNKRKPRRKLTQNPALLTLNKRNDKKETKHKFN